jgi:hypothetical protein
MEQKYKVLFNIFNKFLEINKCETAEIDIESWSFDLSDKNRFFCRRSTGSSSNIPFPIPIVREITEYVEHIIKTEDYFHAENDEEFYRYELLFRPKDRIIELYGMFSTYGTGDETEQVIEAEEEPEVYNPIFDYLDEIRSDIVEVDVDAGGDSGWIHDKAWDINGKEIDVSEEMQDVGYKLLNQFGGWEMNEGSTAKFTWDPGRRILIFNFAYNTEESSSELLHKDSY